MERKIRIGKIHKQEFTYSGEKDAFNMYI